jgi:predicted N-acetyltransferase YhbS
MNRAALEELWNEGNEAHADAPALFRKGTPEDVIDADSIVIHEEDGRPVGFVTFGPAVVGSNEHVCVGQLVVAAKYRGRGIASKLVRAVHELAREKGAKHSMVCVWDGGSLPDFYRKAGYQQVGVLMAREL